MVRRRQSRVKRQLAALGLLVLVLGLLELNRILPGGWPGGGESGGFRLRSEAQTDPSRLRPPLDEPIEWPREGVTVVVRTPGGGVPDAAQLGADGPGGNLAPVDAQGRARLQDAAALDRGFLVRMPGGEIRHGAARPEGTQPWTVHLPADVSTPPPEEIQEMRVRVTAAESGAALAGVAVSVDAPGGTLAGRTDDSGLVRLGPLGARGVLRAEADGRRDARRWVHPRLSMPVEIALVRQAELEVTFTDVRDGTELVPERLRLRSREGEILWEHRPSMGTSAVQRIPVEGDLRERLLEVHHPAHPVVLFPLAEVGPTVGLPAGRLIELKIRDAQSQRLFGTSVTAFYEPPLLGEATSRLTEPLEVAVEAEGHVVLPDGVPARLLVEAAHSHPRRIEIGSDDPAGSRAVALEPGVILPVRVMDAGGVPVSGARIVVVASVEGLELRRKARTADEGRTRVKELPRSPVEVYAHAPGMAWAVTVADLAESRKEVVLQLLPGATLRFVAETALGLPLADVRVHVWPEEGASTGDVVPPDSGPTRTGPDGTLVIEDLPSRPYRVRLSRPGYREVLLRDLRPGPGVHFVTLQAR